MAGGYLKNFKIRTIIASCHKLIHVNNPPIDIDEEEELKIYKKARKKSRAILLEHLTENCQGIYKPKNLEELTTRISKHIKEKENLEQKIISLRSKGNLSKEEEKQLKKATKVGLQGAGVLTGIADARLASQDKEREKELKAWDKITSKIDDDELEGDDKSVGTEINGKERPVLIISIDWYNDEASRVAILPLSSKVKNIRVFEFYLGKIVINDPKNRESKVMVDQIRSIDKQKLGEKCGELTTEQMEKVEGILRKFLVLVGKVEKLREEHASKNPSLKKNTNYPEEKRNEITDLEHVGNIKELNLSDNYLRNLEFIDNLNHPENLIILNIDDNEFTKKDLFFLTRFKNLEELNLGNNYKSIKQIKGSHYNRFYGSLEPLKFLTKLKKLNISTTDISHGLEYLPNSLEKFSCRYNKEIPNAKVKKIHKLLSDRGIVEDDLEYIKNFSEKFRNIRKKPLMKEEPNGIKKNNLHNKITIEAIKQLKDIIKGLIAIHKEGLIHRDLHSGNILSGVVLNDRSFASCFITDLGLCRPANETDKGKIYGVLPYIAPEVLRSLPFTQASDIYSFGIIAYEILTGLPPYCDIPHTEFLATKISEINDKKDTEFYQQYEKTEKVNELSNYKTDLLYKLYKIHPEAIYASRKFYFENLSSSKNSKENSLEDLRISDSKEFGEEKDREICQLQEEIILKKFNIYDDKEYLVSKLQEEKIKLTVRGEIYGNSSPFQVYFPNAITGHPGIDQLIQSSRTDPSIRVEVLEQILSNSLEWKNIHLGFVPELEKAWKELGFSYEQAKELINFAGWFLENGSIEQLREEHSQYLISVNKGIKISVEASKKIENFTPYWNSLIREFEFPLEQKLLLKELEETFMA
ncbi:5557_t:CDS:10 [Funneliformis geosporum]|uniref:5557_t:CDS:1 n=1 Tax=Funneliformis geosporum TaxID=1117311 RepID=A0A9W4WPC2_9GLOM|nr:5557_t:CDS:10 [Funneliformis geosporum]